MTDSLNLLYCSVHVKKLKGLYGKASAWALKSLLLLCNWDVMLITKDNTEGKT